MKEFQEMQGGAARRIRYCLLVATASLLFIGGPLACSSEDSRATQIPAAASPALERPEDRPQGNSEPPVILFLGTSLTAGYGLREDQAFPALIEEKIRAAGLGYRVVNAGVSGDTSAGGLRRLDWLLRLPISVLVLELGANDMLRGQNLDALTTNLDSILDLTAEAYPDVRFLIAGMRAAPNLGPDYQQAFDAIYPDLALRHEAHLIPFLLEDVAARRQLNQADGIHPTAEGHALVADRVWRELEKVLGAN